MAALLSKEEISIFFVKTIADERKKVIWHGCGVSKLQQPRDEPCQLRDVDLDLTQKPSSNSDRNHMAIRGHGEKCDESHIDD